MIDPSSLPCYIRVPDTNVFLISFIDYQYPDNPRYYHDNSWVCCESDNPQLFITLAEMTTYFPERLI